MNIKTQLKSLELQRGVTLVELMVSMLVGLVLLGGVAAVYLGSKQTYGARGGMSSLQENGRIALMRLQTGVLGAGYPKNSGIEPIVSDASRQVEGASGITPSSDNASGDTLTVSFQPFGKSYAQDCLGQDDTTNTKGQIVNNYFVKKDAQGKNGQLMCRGSGNSVAQPIAEGVDNMQVLYGVDTDSDGFANQYLNASSADWNNVVSIQVALLINSIDNVKDIAPGAGNEDTFNLLGQSHTAPNDRLTRRVFTTTIPLRNRMPLLQ